jgi:hypothetical protein
MKLCETLEFIFEAAFGYQSLVVCFCLSGAFSLPYMVKERNVRGFKKPAAQNKIKRRSPAK